jgi:hypothetical protein
MTAFIKEFRIDNLHYLFQNKKNENNNFYDLYFWIITFNNYSISKNELISNDIFNGLINDKNNHTYIKNDKFGKYWNEKLFFNLIWYYANYIDLNILKFTYMEFDTLLTSKYFNDNLPTPQYKVSDDTLKQIFVSDNIDESISKYMELYALTSTLSYNYTIFKKILSTYDEDIIEEDFKNYYIPIYKFINEGQLTTKNRIKNTELDNIKNIDDYKKDEVNVNLYKKEYDDTHTKISNNLDSLVLKSVICKSEKKVYSFKYSNSNHKIYEYDFDNPIIKEITDMPVFKNKVCIAYYEESDILTTIKKDLKNVLDNLYIDFSPKQKIIQKSKEENKLQKNNESSNNFSSLDRINGHNNLYSTNQLKNNSLVCKSIEDVKNFVNLNNIDNN